MQRDRRRDPYPWTWEIPVGVTAAAALTAVIGVQVARGLANLIAGAGWTWPAADTSGAVGTGPGPSSPLGSAFWSSLPGVIGGDAAAGLAPDGQGEVVDGVASSGLLWGTIAVVELVSLGALTWIGIVAYLKWGPGRMRGMATPAEAEALLGVTRLRKVSALVRPDLYGRHTAENSQASSPTSRPGSTLNGDSDRGGRGGDTMTLPVVDPTAEPPAGRLGAGSSPWLRTGRRRPERGDQTRQSDRSSDQRGS